MDQHMYYLVAMAIALGGLIFKAGRELEAIKKTMESFKDIPQRVSHLEARIENLFRARTRK